MSASSDIQTGGFIFLIEGRKGRGLGHLRRCAIARQAIVQAGWSAYSLILADPDIQPLPMDTGIGSQSCAVSNAAEVKEAIEKRGCRAFIVDLASYDAEIVGLLHAIRAQEIPLIAIGSRAWRSFDFDGHYIPGFYVDEKARQASHGVFSVGWQNALVPKLGIARPRTPPQSILVLTGGEDPSGENTRLPALLDKLAPARCQFTLVQGPRAAGFDLSTCVHAERFRVWRPSGAIADQFHRFDAAIAFFGLSVLELLASGIPCLVSDPHGALPDDGWNTVLSDGLLLDGRTSEVFEANFKSLLEGWKPAINTPTLFRADGVAFAEFVRSILD